MQVAADLAELEGLDGHRQAALIRIPKETLINKEKLSKTSKEDNKTTK